ncbi:hydrolase [Canna indica]|uniref:Hydrolase n=1 Tax=Canna indica TaxID=4628 RepID=A0AAQ3KHJ8_9LILI|nr:hydrolase [Canna indica]
MTMNTARRHAKSPSLRFSSSISSSSIDLLDTMESPDALKDEILCEGDEAEGRMNGGGQSSLVFLGTGCSSAVPSARCLIQPTDPPCPVCTESLSIPPEENPNYKCNTSLLIDYCQDDGAHSYIQIDVGKTFREQVLRWFTGHKIPRIDSIVLTHEHADAVLGLDDIRMFPRFSPTNDIDPIPIYCTQYTVDSIAKRFPYLVKRRLEEGQIVRFIAQLDWNIIDGDPEKPFVISGLEFVPLPIIITILGKCPFLFIYYLQIFFFMQVMHGEDYISDVSRFPAATEYLISESGAGQLDLLIIDTNSLRKVVSRSTHFSFPETLDALKRIRPKRALLIGMTHDYDHHTHNKILEEWSIREGIPVQLARDGLRVFIDL